MEQPRATRAATSERPLVRLERVEKSYATAAGEFVALRGVDVEMAAGELVAVVGRSGSGKSTLLHLLGGLDRPNAGGVWVGDMAVHAATEQQLARWRGAEVGIVFQFFQLLPTLTVVENVLLPMDFLGTRAVRERRPRARALLAELGIAEHGDKLPAALSGGQQQRAAIARALANEPSLLLADEPTGNLDSQTAELVFAQLRALADRGTTVVVATHERDFGALADRVITLVDGAVVTVDSRRVDTAVGTASRSTESAHHHGSAIAVPIAGGER